MATINLDNTTYKPMPNPTSKRQFGFHLLRAIAESAFDNLALVIAPLLPAFLFGLSVGQYLTKSADSTIAAIIGVAAGFSIEASGFMAFKAKEKSDNAMLAISYLIVGCLITVVLEAHDWRRMVIGLAGFSIVAIVYWSINTIDAVEAAEAARAIIEEDSKRIQAENEAAEAKRIEEEQAWQREQEEKRVAFEREQEAQAAEFERQMKAQEAELKAQLKLKKVTGATSSNSSDWRLLSAQQRAQLATMETSEIVSAYGVSPSTARRWKSKASD